MKTAVSFDSSASSGQRGKFGSSGYEAAVFQEKSAPLKVNVSLHKHWIVLNCQYPGLLVSVFIFANVTFDIGGKPERAKATTVFAGRLFPTRARALFDGE